MSDYLVLLNSLEPSRGGNYPTQSETDQEHRVTTNADRKYRKQRTTALTCGLMAEVAMGTSLLVGSTSPLAAESAVFGPGGSIAAVATAIVLVALAMLVIVLAPRLGSPLRRYSPNPV